MSFAFSVDRLVRAPSTSEGLVFGITVANRLFKGRKGHGGNPMVAERHLKQEQLAAMLTLAFDAGMQYGREKK